MKKLVYLISPKKIDKNFYIILRKVLLSNKVKFFQLRLKNISDNKLIKIAKKIKIIVKKYRVKLIINDKPKIALKIGADGCHIGQMDGNINIIRKAMKKKVLGITCHSSRKLALNAIKNKADYIALGSFYKSKLKPNAKKANFKVLKWAKKNINVPIVVIGGINDKNYKKLINVGANYIAISSYIWDNPALKPEAAIKKFK